MGKSKIVYYGETLIDLTQDTVKQDKVLSGYTFTGADGEKYTGTCTFDANTQDATAADSEILAGKSAYVKGAKVTGKMKDNGGVAIKISTLAPVTVAQGYHDGSGSASIADSEKAKIIPENIRQGVTLLGVTGEMSGTEGANPQAVEVTPSNEEQSILPGDGYNYISQVTVKAVPYSESDNSAGGKTVTIGA